jgi:hypothetical protein
MGRCSASRVRYVYFEFAIVRDRGYIHALVRHHVFGQYESADLVLRLPDIYAWLQVWHRICYI